MPVVIDTAFVEIFPQFKNFAGQVQSEVDAAGRQIGAASTRSIAQVGQQITQAGQQLSQVGGQLTRRVTLPLVGVGTAAFKAASDFEANMAKIVGLVGVPREQVQAWEDDVRSLAVEFGKSGTEASEALFFITSAGLEGDAAMSALEASLKASAVGLGDTATIADLATSAMNAYSSEGLTAANATDILAATVREGKLEASELAGAMGRVLPVASAMGVGMDEVGAALAAMSRTGTNAAEGTTQLRGILTSILKPTTEAEEALEGMGLSAGGLRQQIEDEGLLSVLETLSEEFQGNDEAAAQVFGNVRALSGVMDLMGDNAEGTKEIFGALTDTTGDLDTAFDATAETSAFKMQQAMAEVKDLLLEIGQSVMPVVVDALGRVRDLVERLSEAWKGLSPGQQRMIIQAAAIAAAVGPVLLIFGQLFTSIGGIISIVGRLAPLFAGLLGPIGLIVIGIGALVAASPELRATLGAAFQQVLEALKPLIPVFQNLIATILPILIQVVNQLVEALIPVVITVAEVVAQVVAALVPAFQKLITAVMPVIPAVLGIVQAIVPLIALIGRLVAEVLPRWIKIQAALVAAIVPVIVWLAELIATVVDVVVNIITWITELDTSWSEIWGGIVSFLEGVLTALVDFGTALMEGFLDGIVAGFEAVTSWFGELPDRVVEFVSNAINWLVRGGRDTISGFRTGIVDRFVAVRDWLRGMRQRIQGLFGTAISWLLSAGRRILSGLRTGIVERWSAVRTWLTSLRTRVLNIFGNAANWLWSAGRNIISGLWDGMKSIWDSVTGWLGGLGSTIANLKGPESVDRALLRQSGQWIMQGLQNGLRDEEANLVRLLRDVTGMIQMDTVLPGARPGMVSGAAGAGGGAMDVSTFGATFGAAPAVAGPQFVAPAGGGGDEIIELHVDLGEGIRQVVQVRLDEQNRDLRRRSRAGTGRA